MSLISRAADLYYTFRFLRILVTPWNEMEAFDHGIIDANGRVLRKSADLITSEEKASYTLFHRLVFNIKRILNKFPLGKTRIASYAAALFLLKEHTKMSEEAIARVLTEVSEYPLLKEEKNTWLLSEEGNLLPGIYSLRENVVLSQTVEPFAYSGTRVDVPDVTKPCGSIFGVPIFEVRHRETKQLIRVSTSDLVR